MKVIHRITELRNERGWTNHRMAIEAGISSPTVTNWYNTRKSEPSLNAIISLCEAFEISLSDFFNPNKEYNVLTPFQKEMLSEICQLSKAERDSLLQYIKITNTTRKQHS